MPQPSEATDAEQAHDATDLTASAAAEAAIVMPSTSLDALSQENEAPDGDNDQADAVADQPSLDTTADDISATLADQDYDDARITKEDITLSTAAPRDDSDAASQRRSRLPDIEEMSQSWSIVDETDARADEEQALLISQTRRKSGFNFGFFTMIFVAIAAAMIYWRADDIIDYVPQMEPALDLYLDEVDALRGWVQRTARDIGLWTIDLANEIKAESAIEPE
jgi:hypothetical protein